MAAPPPRIARGQTIGVCAPAGPVRPDRLARGVARLSDAFAIRLAPSLANGGSWPPGPPGYLAGPDDQRADELGALIADPDVRAIVLARGGYGLMRILPQLDPAPLQRDPKPIVAFSDGTALLAWAHRAGVRGIHGPMVAQLGELGDADFARLVTMLTEPVPAGAQPWSLVACPGARRSIHRGPLIAGNLTMVSMLAGTPWPVPLDDAIAVIEDVGERPYELDRYLTQLALLGELARPSAVVIGDLERCVEPDAGGPDDAALRTICERLVAAGKPCASGAPVGHGVRNAAIPFGAAAELDLDRGVLSILEAAVQ